MKKEVDYCDRCLPRIERKAKYLVWRAASTTEIEAAAASCRQHLQATIAQRSGRSSGRNEAVTLKEIQ